MPMSVAKEREFPLRQWYTDSELVLEVLIEVDGWMGILLSGLLHSTRTVAGG